MVRSWSSKASSLLLPIAQRTEEGAEELFFSLSDRQRQMAAGVVVEDFEVIGFEEAMSCLPSHVLDEAIWETKQNNTKVFNLIFNHFSVHQVLHIKYR